MYRCIYVYDMCVSFVLPKFDEDMDKWDMMVFKSEIRPNHEKYEVAYFNVWIGFKRMWKKKWQRSECFVFFI